MRETYTFKIAPGYTSAHYVSGNYSTVMPEWSGRTLAEFAAGMAGRGFSHRVESYELSRGRFEEHVWEK